MNAVRPTTEKCPRLAFVTSALFVGLLIVTIEFVVGAILEPVPHLDIDWLDRIIVIAPVLFVCATLGLIFGYAWPLGFVFTVFAAWRVGLHLSMGVRAINMPLSQHWALIAALGVASFLLITRLFPRTRLVRRFLPLLAVPFVLVAFGLAATSYRGSYQIEREGIFVVGAAILVVELQPFMRARRRRAVAALVLGAFVVAIICAFALTRDQARRDWAWYRTSMPTVYVTPIWTHFGREIPPPAEFPKRPRPKYFGTDLAMRTAATIFGDRERPSVVLLLTIDSLRHDLVGTEVNGRSVTPFFDELAEAGFRFTRCYAPSNSTNATFFATFSGSYPSEVKERPENFNEMPLVTEKLRRHGIECRGVFSKVVGEGGIFSAEPTRLALDFDAATLQGLEDFSPEGNFKRLDALRESSSLFGFVHFMRPHAPYDSAEAKYRDGDTEFDGYVAELRQADAEARALVQLFRDAGHDDIFVIMGSDHGEEFHDHGLTFHGRQLFDESIRVPLVIAGPGVPHGQSDDAIALLDIAPTLEDIFGIGIPGASPTSGRSLLPLVAGLDDPERSRVVFSEMPNYALLQPPLRQRAIITRETKTIINPPNRLQYHFDLVNDPGELTNLAPGRPEIVARDRGIARAHLYPTELLEHDEDWSTDVIDQLEAIDLDRLVDAVVNHDRDVSSSVESLAAYAAPLLSRRALRELIDALDDQLDDATRSLLSLAAGTGEAELRQRVADIVATSRDPLVIDAGYTILGRLGDRRLLDRRRQQLASRKARFAADLAESIYRQNFTAEDVNFRFVLEVDKLGSSFLMRRVADYIAFEKRTTDSGVFFDALSEAETLRHRAALMRSVAYLKGDDVDAVVARTLAEADAEVVFGALADHEGQVPQRAFITAVRGLTVEADGVRVDIPATNRRCAVIFFDLSEDHRSEIPVSATCGDTRFQTDAASIHPNGGWILVLPTPAAAATLTLTLAGGDRNHSMPPVRTIKFLAEVPGFVRN